MESSSQTTRGSRNGDWTLVIMAKAPRPGMVKTRLARSLPLPAVTALYRCFFDDTMALARSLDAVEVAIMCPGSDVGELAGLAGDAARGWGRKGRGLSARPGFLVRTIPRALPRGHETVENR